MIRRFKLASFCTLILTALAMSGCTASLTRGTAQVQPAQEIFRDDLDVDSLRSAIHQSASYLVKVPPGHIVGGHPRPLTAKEIVDSLSVFEKLLDQWSCPECLSREIGHRFELIPSSSEPQLSEVLFTGYYQPVVEGSLVPTEVYRYPLYGKPAELITAEQVTLDPTTGVEEVLGRVEGEQFLPFYSRREIDELGSLQGRGLEIAWLKDPVDVFFLHIQGSGIVRLPDGGQVSVGYAAQNGRPYRSIGRLLIDRGKVSKEEMSMQWLRRFLEENPGERDEVFAYNESYVFFRVTQPGPFGSLGVPITAGRTIATDSRLFPKGALVLIATQIPVLDEAGQLSGWRSITRFVLNQDTGGAIRGFQRADLYFGTGDEAAGLAGYMNRSGKIYFLVLKGKNASTEQDSAKDESKKGSN